MLDQEKQQYRLRINYLNKKLKYEIYPFLDRISEMQENKVVCVCPMCQPAIWGQISFYIYH